MAENNYFSSADARSMAEVTQSPLQLQGVTSQWLLKVLPWVDVTAGVYQVNRTVYDEKKKEVIQTSSECNHDKPVITLPRTASFPEMTPAPRVYELSVVQTILGLQSRAVDLYNEPFNTSSTQIQLTIQALREKQENELINNPTFGLLASISDKQTIKSANNLPTPDALDRLISLRRNTQFLFAHPKTITAFGIECNKAGLIIQNIPLGESLVPSWRGIPILPCSKIPVKKGKSSILAMRTGEDNGGVVGLRPKTLPDQVEAGINLRFMGINEQSIISYLISNYFSVAVLLPNALGILKDVIVESTD
ncbi:MAG: hypothetical protein Q9M50_06855 [Methylococcales bacterium]|nr:hypothetical protein [Methylococcales bacterium]